jgi:hypothetical protein
MIQPAGTNGTKYHLLIALLAICAIALVSVHSRGAQLTTQLFEGLSGERPFFDRGQRLLFIHPTPVGYR